MLINDINKNYEKCLRCNRKLRTEESKKLGFGKVCWEKWQKETSCKQLFNLEGSENNASK